MMIMLSYAVGLPNPTSGAPQDISSKADAPKDNMRMDEEYSYMPLKIVFAISKIPLHLHVCFTIYSRLCVPLKGLRVSCVGQGVHYMLLIFQNPVMRVIFH